MKVYIVSTGWYSDYDVRGIFSTKEKARYAKKFWCSENNIEPFELDELPEHPKDYFFFKVLMNRNGDSDSGVQRCEPSNSRMDFRVTAEWLTDHWSFFVWARDEEHAIKIANERRAALIATGKWDAE
jgi:hypothetical protein